MNQVKHEFNKGDIVIMHGTVVTVVRAWAGGCIVGIDSNGNTYSQDYTDVRVVR
jgi:tartrate dehydratase beta subunit/fumarate hydratase class I family protein